MPYASDLRIGLIMKLHHSLQQYGTDRRAVNLEDRWKEDLAHDLRQGEVRHFGADRATPFDRALRMRQLHASRPDGVARHRQAVQRQPQLRLTYRVFVSKVFATPG